MKLILSIVVAVAITIPNIFAQPSSNDSIFTVKISNLNSVELGDTIDVPVTLGTTTTEVTGFDILIKYDWRVLWFVTIEPSSALFSDSGCGWEHFSYRYGPSTHCGTQACSVGYLRIVGVAETNDGDNHPNCLTFDEDTELFNIRFLTTNDYIYECSYSPIEFSWYDCFDNKLFLDPDLTPYTAATQLRTFDNHSPQAPYPPADSFPNNLGTLEVCADTVTGHSLERRIDFYHGGLELKCGDPFVEIGDINLNTIAYQIADWILFKSYFIYGEEVFTVNPVSQILASDINLDTETLRIEDLILLWRIMESEILPLFEPFDTTSPNVATFTQYPATNRSWPDIVELSTPDTLQAIQFIFDGEIYPVSLDTNIEIVYYADAGQTWVLAETFVSSLVQNTAIYLQGPLLHVSGDGQLVEVNTATYTGVKVNTSINFSSDIGDDDNGILPHHFDLHQNYPNPFNNETNIGFELPQASLVRFEVVNLLGQIVYSIEQRYSAGIHSISWKGQDNSGNIVTSGVYYYRIIAGNFIDSKKMILLK